MLPTRRFTYVLSTLALAGSAGSASALVFDSFLDPLPPHPLLVASAKPILFVGPMCDGDACPPGTVVDGEKACDLVVQDGLPGVYGGERGVVLCDYSSFTPVQLDATIDPASGRLHVAQGVGEASQVEITLGATTVYWNLDLVALGADRFEVEVAGVSPGLVLDIRIDAAWGLPPQDGVAFLQRSVSAAGVASFPLDEFSGQAEPDWTKVRSLRIFLQGTADAPSHYSLAEIRALGTPTATAPTSWGRLKSSYR